MFFYYLFSKSKLQKASFKAENIKFLSTWLRLSNHRRCATLAQLLRHFKSARGFIIRFSLTHPEARPEHRSLRSFEIKRPCLCKLYCLRDDRGFGRLYFWEEAWTKGHVLQLSFEWDRGNWTEQKKKELLIRHFDNSKAISIVI